MFNITPEKCVALFREKMGDIAPTAEQRAQLQKWVNNLRSGEYKQLTNGLVEYDYKLNPWDPEYDELDYTNPVAFCCLGVHMMATLGPEGLERNRVEDMPDPEWFYTNTGLNEAVQDFCALMNDKYGFDFQQIAKIIIAAVNGNLIPEDHLT